MLGVFTPNSSILLLQKERVLYYPSESQAQNKQAEWKMGVEKHFFPKSGGNVSLYLMERVAIKVAETF